MKVSSLSDWLAWGPARCLISGELRAKSLTGDEIETSGKKAEQHIKHQCHAKQENDRRKRGVVEEER